MISSLNCCSACCWLGPATNIASLVALISKFGRKVLGTYLVAIAAVGVMMGVIFDSLYDDGFYTPVAAAGVYEHGGITPLETGS